MRILSICLLLFIAACKTTKETVVAPIFSGQWRAQWDTDPSGFGDAPSSSIFTMDGYFSFSGADDVTVTAYGFPGCIFSSDTLSHTLKWKISNDTLSLINEGDVYGINYQIKELTDRKILLQLMDDIYITLERESTL